MMSKINGYKPNPEHDRLYNELVQVIGKFPHMPSDHILAIFGQVTGRLVALLDQHKFTTAMAMEIVAQNIESGNQQVLDSLTDTKGNG